MAQASAEKLEHTGPAEKKKELPQCHLESSWQVRQSCLCQKKKKKRRLSKASDHEGGESQGERQPRLGNKERGQSGSIKRKGWTPR